MFDKEIDRPVMPHSSTKSHIVAGCGWRGDPSNKTKVVPRRKYIINIKFVKKFFVKKFVVDKFFFKKFVKKTSKKLMLDADGEVIHHTRPKYKGIFNYLCYFWFMEKVTLSM